MVALILTKGTFITRTSDADYRMRAQEDFYGFIENETRRIIGNFAVDFCEVPWNSGRTRMAVRSIKAVQNIYVQAKRLLKAIER